MKGRAATGPFPLYRGKTGSKHHVIVEAYGIPLATILTGGNRHDVTQLLPLIEAVPPIRGRPRRRPGHLYTDRVCRPRLRPRGLSRPGDIFRVQR
jgi:Transposase DDE domain